MANRANRNGGAGGAGGADADNKPSDTTNKKKLSIANELKMAFASNLCVSEEDIDKIIAKVNAQENYSARKIGIHYLNRRFLSINW